MMEQVFIGGHTTHIQSEELVEVLDLTFYLAVPGVNGEPAKLHYTVREHEGDKVTEPPTGGGIRIQFADRVLQNRTVPGKTVTLSSTFLIGMERDIRLEKRVRPSIAKLVDPARELRAKLNTAVIETEVNS